MRAVLKWQDGMSLSAEVAGNSVMMDATPPLGGGKGMTPKELVACGLGGCTTMDVLALLKKHKQAFDSIHVDVDVTPSSGAHPIVFEKAHLVFSVAGDVDPKILLDSIRLSQTKYCGVSAMLSRALPITYSVVLNGKPVGEGRAEF